MTEGENGPSLIEDPTDSGLDPFRAVRDKDLRADGGRFVVEAPRVISRFLDAVAEGRFEIDAVVLDPRIVPSALIERIRDVETSCCFASTEVIDEVSGYRFHAGAIAIGIRPRTTPGLDALLARMPQTGPLTLCGLAGVTSMDNVGSVFRAAAALGVDGIVLDASCCDPLVRRCLRISMGQVFRMPFAVVEDLVPALRRLREEAGVATLAIENLPDAPLLHEVASPPRVMLAIGNEGHGLPAELVVASDGARRIAGAPDLPESERPGGDDERSLNAHVAAAVAFHEVLRRRDVR